MGCYCCIPSIVLSNPRCVGKQTRVAQVLEKSRIKTIADVKRVSREIKILKKVRHPNIIALYEVLDTPSTIYFMMEHCDG